MDIEGLSEATLEKFIGQGFIHSYLDIYRLDRYRAEIVRMDGFGEKSGSAFGTLSNRAETPPLSGI